jgi:D-methionine transport system permease protein
MQTTFFSNFLYLWNKINFFTILNSTYDTLYITFISSFLVGFLGLLIGITLFITDKKSLYPSQTIYKFINATSNIIKSIPFIILIIIMLPITKFLVGTILGKNAAIPPLIIGLAPYYGNLVYNILKNNHKGIIELGRSLGASNYQIIFKLLIPENAPLLISSLTTIIITIIGFTATAGIIGAGGLGNLAFIEGFQRNNNIITIIATFIILFFVFVIQLIGDKISNKFNKV